MREHKTPSSESHIIIKVEMRTVSEIMNEEVIPNIYIYACIIYMYVLYYIFIYNSYFATYAVAYLDIKRTCT